MTAKKFKCIEILEKLCPETILKGSTNSKEDPEFQKG